MARSLLSSSLRRTLLVAAAAVPSRFFTSFSEASYRSTCIHARYPVGAGSLFMCKRHLGFALDPDFYEIPHVFGVPEGGKLMLFNLPSTDDREKLKKDLMAWFTDIEDEKLTIVNFEYTDDPEWNAKGVGAFIEFPDKMQASIAVARLDASKFQGRYVRMDFVERKPFPPEWLAKNAKWFTGEHATEGVVVPNSKVFVGNLPWSIDDEKLKGLFAVHGTVYDAKVLKDRETGRSRGFGFVTMSNDDEMNAAIEAMNGKLVDGRHLKVNSAQNKPE